MTTVDNNSIAWTKAVSTNGNIFEVGLKNAEGSEPLAGPTGSIPVDWKPNTSGKTTQEVQDKTGIVFYSLQGPRPGIYTWLLELITNRKCDDILVAASGDKYGINFSSAGSHYLRFNAENLTIVRIDYS